MTASIDRLVADFITGVQQLIEREARASAVRFLMQVRAEASRRRRAPRPKPKPRTRPRTKRRRARRRRPRKADPNASQRDPPPAAIALELEPPLPVPANDVELAPAPAPPAPPPAIDTEIPALVQETAPPSSLDADPPVPFLSEIRMRQSTDRPATYSLPRLRRVERAALAVYPPDAERPRVRGDCVDGPRPCPWVSCRHHLYLEVVGRAIKVAHPALDPHELPETCVLDVAARGGLKLEEIGGLLNLTRERIRQIEEHGMAMVRRAINTGQAPALAERAVP